MNYRNLLISTLGGALYPLAFAPISWWWCAYSALAILLWTCEDSSPKQAFWQGLGFGLCAFGIGVSWVFISIHEHGFAPIWLAASLTALFVSFLAAILALGLFLWARYFPLRSRLRYWCFPVIWLLFEGLRATILGGFPWLLMGTAQLHTPLSTLAPLGSVWSMSFVAVAMLSCSYALIRRIDPKAHLLGLSFLTCLALASHWHNWVSPLGEPISLALVQGNIPQPKRWDQHYLNSIINRYLELSKDLAEMLVIWPESAIPVPLEDIHIEVITLLRSHPQMALITGNLVFGPQSSDYFNALVGVGRARGIYLKEHLVPFGEYVPFESWLRGVIHFLDLPQSAYQPGPAQQRPLSTPWVSLAPAICYEIAFPGLVRKRLNHGEAGAIITVSNDAWFGHSLGPYQHLELAQLRALETGRYVLRATNSGISAIINPNGTLGPKLGLGQTGRVLGTFFAMQGITPWIQFGYGPLLLLIIIWGLLARVLLPKTSWRRS